MFYVKACKLFLYCSTYVCISGGLLHEALSVSLTFHHNRFKLLTIILYNYLFITTTTYLLLLVIEYHTMFRSGQTI